MPIRAVVSPLAVAVLPERLANRNGSRLRHQTRRFFASQTECVVTSSGLVPQLHIALVDCGLEMGVPLLLRVNEGPSAVVAVVSSLRHRNGLISPLAL